MAFEHHGVQPSSEMHVDGFQLFIQLFCTDRDLGYKGQEAMLAEKPQGS